MAYILKKRFISVALFYCTNWLLTTLFALQNTQAQTQRQRPLIYLSVSQPAGPLLVNSTKDFSNVTTIIQNELQTNGYSTITNPDTLRKLVSQPSIPSFLYADVVCYQHAGSFPTVVFAVRDTLGALQFVTSESVTVFINQQRAFSSAAERIASKIPVTFNAKTASESPTTRPPLFMEYDQLKFESYLGNELYSSPIRQQMKRGATLDFNLIIDEFGFASLQSVDSEINIDSATQQLLETALRRTPPWSPAYGNGRRVSGTMRISIGRANAKH